MNEGNCSFDEERNDLFIGPNIFFYESNINILQPFSLNESVDIINEDNNNQSKWPKYQNFEIPNNETGANSFKKLEFSPLNAQNISNSLNDKHVKEIKIENIIDDNLKKTNQINKKSSNTNKSLNNKKRGRKTNGEKGNHNKFYEDNMTKKFKSKFTNVIREFINSELEKTYNGKIGEGNKIRKLFRMNDELRKTNSVDFNKALLYRNLKDIFSYNISGKFSKYPEKHNLKIIEEVLNDEDLEIRRKFETIFNFTFLDCLRHFRNENPLDELKGMKTLDEFCKQFDDDEEYQDCFRKFISKFETNIMEKKGRKSKKKE